MTSPKQHLEAVATALGRRQLQQGQEEGEQWKEQWCRESGAKCSSILMEILTFATTWLLKQEANGEK